MYTDNKRNKRENLQAAHYNTIRFLQPAKQTLLFLAAILERL